MTQTKQTLVGWWMEEARANDLRLSQELETLREEIATFYKELTATENRRQQAFRLDSKLARRAEGMAASALGSSFSIRKGNERISGKITRCVFAGFTVTRTGRSYKALWEVTVTSSAGGSLTGLYDRLPR